MRTRLLRSIALVVATSLLSTGCLLSRAVDRAFLGITVRQPTFVDRKTTGIFLLPITFAVDVATFPIQALLIVILGDQFPFNDSRSMTDVIALNDSPQFKALSDEKKALAQQELLQLLERGTLTANSTLALGEDGHWTVVEVSNEARAQLIARAGAPVAAPVAVACVP